MFREIVRAREPEAIRDVLRTYLSGNSREDALLFLASYLSRSVAGFIPDPDRLEP